MLIDSNLIIYATQPQYTELRKWLVNHATHYSAISRVETLGYHDLHDADKKAIYLVLEELKLLMISHLTLEIAISLRQKRKMSLGDAFVAASALEHSLVLATANTRDFTWINGLVVHNPLSI